MLEDEETGSLVRETRTLVEDYIKPDVRTLEEPNTGTKALVSLTAAGALAIPSSVFDSYRARPLQLRGTATLLSLDSLIEHANRFKDADSVVFANDDRTAPSINAVYDYHEPANDGGDDRGIADATDIARHMLHRATFAFPLSDEWKAWMAKDGKAMPMVEFAEFLEERVIDVLHLIPGEDEMSEDLQKYIAASGGDGGLATPQKLVELSRGLQVHETSVVREANKLSSGEAQLIFKSEHSDENGEPLRVPGLFLIAIPVFRSGAFYRMAARLRYRKTAGGIVFWYDLWRVDRTFDHAFREACERVKVETGLPVLLGKPEA